MNRQMCMKLSGIFLVKKLAVIVQRATQSQESTRISHHPRKPQKDSIRWNTTGKRRNFYRAERVVLSEGGFRGWMCGFSTVKWRLMMILHPTSPTFAIIINKYTYAVNTRTSYNTFFSYNSKEEKILSCSQFFSPKNSSSQLSFHINDYAFLSYALIIHLLKMEISYRTRTSSEWTKHVLHPRWDIPPRLLVEGVGEEECEECNFHLTQPSRSIYFWAFFENKIEQHDNIRAKLDRGNRPRRHLIFFMIMGFFSLSYVCTYYLHVWVSCREMQYAISPKKSTQHSVYCASNNCRDPTEGGQDTGTFSCIVIIIATRPHPLSGAAENKLIPPEYFSPFPIYLELEIPYE